MYTEFIIIYILLVIAIAIGIINLILLLKKNSAGSGNFQSNNSSFQVNAQQDYRQSNVPDQTVQNDMGNRNSGVVFCRKCAHQYSASEKFCPYCGTPHN